MSISCRMGWHLLRPTHKVAAPLARGERDSRTGPAVRTYDLHERSQRRATRQVEVEVEAGSPPGVRLDLEFGAHRLEQPSAHRETESGLREHVGAAAGRLAQRPVQRAEGRGVDALPLSRTANCTRDVPSSCVTIST